MAHKEPPSSLLLVRGNNRRVAILVIGILSLLAMFFLTFSPHLAIHHCGHSEQQRSMITETMSFSSGNTNDGEVSRRQARFTDLNDLTATSQAARNEEHVLILTPLKNAVAYLPRYFEMVNRLQYPHHLISLGFLVSDTADRTVQLLQDRADEILNRDPPDDDSSSNNTRYHSVSIFEKDFDFELPEDRRHEFEMQPLRRSFMARARNYLLSAALKDEHAWVLWLDVDVIDYPASILTDLQSIDVDVVVPNCLRQTDENQSMGYDKNNWMETQQSLDMQKKLDPVSSLILDNCTVYTHFPFLLCLGLCFTGR
jgi:hypothetical protein